MQTVGDVIGHFGCCIMLLNSMRISRFVVRPEGPLPYSRCRRATDMMSGLGIRPTWIERKVGARQQFPVLTFYVRFHPLQSFGTRAPQALCAIGAFHRSRTAARSGAGAH
jgi:hypothetical protein